MAEHNGSSCHQKIFVCNFLQFRERSQSARRRPRQTYDWSVPMSDMEGQDSPRIIVALEAFRRFLESRHAPPDDTNILLFSREFFSSHMVGTTHDLFHRKFRVSQKMVNFLNMCQPFLYQDGFRAIQRGKRRYFRDTGLQAAASELVRKCQSFTEERPVNAEAARETGARRRDEAAANMNHPTPDVDEREELGMINSLSGNRCV